MWFVTDIRERLKVVGLPPEDYFDVLKANATLRIVGGAIYDALIAACPLKSGAEKLFTWNLRHYAQFGSKVAALLQTPQTGQGNHLPTKGPNKNLFV